MRILTGFVLDRLPERISDFGVERRGGDTATRLAQRKLLLASTLIGLLATGCFHQKAAAPKENYTEIPGLPKSTQPAPVEVKQSQKPPKKQATKKASKEETAQVRNANHTEQDVHPVTQAAAPTTGVKTPSEKLIVTPDNGLVGKVETVNQSARYVVLSFPIGHLPAMEQRLNVYRRGLKVGEVKVTGPQIEDNVVADIVEGESGNGDEVRDK